jgi:hypothetical protein
LAGDPETLIVDSTLLPVLHPRQVKQSAAGFEGAAWSRWGSFCVYGVKLHLVCSSGRVPLSYEMSAANAADVLLLVEELLAGAGLRRRAKSRGGSSGISPTTNESGALRRRLGESGILLWSGGASRRPARRQHIEICLAHLKGALGVGQTLAKTLVGLTIRIAAKVRAYTYGLYVNWLLGRPQGRIKELWA